MPCPFVLSYAGGFTQFFTSIVASYRQLYTDSSRFVENWQAFPGILKWEARKPSELAGTLESRNWHKRAKILKKEILWKNENWSKCEVVIFVINAILNEGKKKVHGFKGFCSGRCLQRVKLIKRKDGEFIAEDDRIENKAKLPISSWKMRISDNQPKIQSLYTRRRKSNCQKIRKGRCKGSVWSDQTVPYLLFQNSRKRLK